MKMEPNITLNKNDSAWTNTLMLSGKTARGKHHRLFKMYIQGNFFLNRAPLAWKISTIIDNQ